MRHDPNLDPIELDEGVLGVLTDIHANPYALEAVLTDGLDHGVERWLVLGDVVAMGPEPGRVLEQLAELDVVAFIAGNTERYVLTGDRPDPTFDEVASDPQLLPRLVEVAASFAWTNGFLSGRGLLDGLSSYRPTVGLSFPDGTSVLAVHASLVADDGQGIAPDLGADEVVVLFPEVTAALVFGGHTHQATDLTFGGTRFVNPGSVSNHDQPHLGARYSLVRLRSGDHSIEQREVSYDKQLVIDSIIDSTYPGAGFLLRRYFGVVS